MPSATTKRWNAARQALRCDERFVPALTLRSIKASMASRAVTSSPSRSSRQALAIRRRQRRASLHQGLDASRSSRVASAIRADRVPRAPCSFVPTTPKREWRSGTAQLAGGNYREALQNFQAAARTSRRRSSPCTSASPRATGATKQWNKAKASFEKALADGFGNLAQAHFNMGLMYMTAGADFPGLNELRVA